MNDDRKRTVSGTNIEDVKKRNKESGLTYNEAKAALAQTGGKGTKAFSNTDPEKVRSQIRNSKNN